METWHRPHPSRRARRDPLPVIRTCLLQLLCLSWQGLRTLLGFFLCPRLPRNRMMPSCSALDAPSRTLPRWFHSLLLWCPLRTSWRFLQPFLDLRGTGPNPKGPFCTTPARASSWTLLRVSSTGLVMARTGLRHSGQQQASVSACSSSSRRWSCFAHLLQVSGQAA